MVTEADSVNIFHESLSFPMQTLPAGIEKVGHYNQLDPASLALAQLWSKHGAELSPPDAILLASPHASNESDFAFVKSGFQSPQKFVHTLPNVRITPFCQLMCWQGPVLCVQKDPYTFSSALQETLTFLGEWNRIWVMGCLKISESVHDAILFEVTANDTASVSLWNGLNDGDVWNRVKLNSWNR